MWREVLSMLGVAMKDFSRNNCSYIAAGIAYWTLFSLFPLAMAAISILGFVYAAPEDQGRIVEQGMPFRRSQIALLDGCTTVSLWFPPTIVA